MPKVMDITTIMITNPQATRSVEMPSMNSQQLLSLLHISSPTLPIGGFAYSQGLESAIELGWVENGDNLVEWLSGVLVEGVGKLDVPVFYRLFEAYAKRNSDVISYWDQFLKANRETHELLFEDEQLGDALQKLVKSLNLVNQSAIQALPPKPCYLTVFAMVSSDLALNPEDALTGLLWNWLDNQVVVACKTIPLGQTMAQKSLLALMPLLSDVVERGTHIDDSEIGNTLPGLAMASSLHETQYSRLFRS